MENASPLILCVDDEAVGLRVRQMLLERAGYRVLTAPDGATALALFQQHPVRGVVLDYAMPGMNGGEVASRMRAQKPEVPILLLSAYVGLPVETATLVDRSMTKGEGGKALLRQVRQLFASPASQS